MSVDIMVLFCSVYIRICLNNFYFKSSKLRDMLFNLKDSLSIKDKKLFKACRSVCSSVPQSG